MKFYFKTIVLILLTFEIFEVKAQDSVQKTDIINFFLDCEDCDFTFVRQELPFISFVRDAKLADIHILVTDSHTGSGGNKYFMNFIGLRSFKDMNYNYSLVTEQSDTDDNVRKSLLKLIKIGILPYYSKTDFIDNINIDLEEAEKKNSDNPVNDPWKMWVFRLETGGEFQKEESQNAWSSKSEARVEKITKEWKTSIEAEFEINRENYYDDEQLIYDKQDSRYLTGDFIKSFTDKWSAGFFGSYESRTFLNIKNNYGSSAGIEYNFFPWEVSNRKVFAVRYVAGLNIVNYSRKTIYEKLKENLFSESLQINLELIQPWGEISLGLEGKHYFHDFSKCRFTLESDFSIRLSKNFSVFCEFRSEIIHDQLYLPFGDASLEDILLKRRKLATTYEISGNTGLRFTFGSFYNNIVNERFNQ